MALNVSWLQNGASTAAMDRQLFDALWSEGVLSPSAGGLAVSASSVNTVSVAAGKGVITGDDVANQGKYLVDVTTAQAVALNPAPGAQMRYDVVYLQVRDPDAGGAAGDDARAYFVEGATHATTPVVPSVPATAIALAKILRTSGDVAITSGMITDLRSAGALASSAVKYVRAASITNVTLVSAVEAGDTFGGVTLNLGDRVGLLGQTTASEDGVYIVNASGAPTRAPDFDGAPNTLVAVSEGTLADKWYQLTTNAPIVLGTTNQTWAEFGAGGAPVNGGTTVATAESTTSTSYTDLTTPGPAKTLTTGTKALVVLTMAIEDTGTGAANIGSMSFVVSGASTLAAADARSVSTSQAGTTDQHASAVYLIEGLTAGSNVFTAKFKTNVGTTKIIDRHIAVIDMGS